ncbi:MAG: 6-phosphofructokinase [Phycisphaerae bacterium]|nr:6-phosphofructokinase [Phycisphaerae bacterium]|tara:strand:+ start:751 stop:2013 length:1263 start_codon:yes stop_codon:yes gene_type:complete
MSAEDRLAIVVGGGPAPGINSVIAAACIRARLEGMEVLGVRDGFSRLMEGDRDCLTSLTIDRVSRIHFRGGSALGTSRANPTRDAQSMKSTIDTLRSHGVTMLLTIGGDDTAYSARCLGEAASEIRVAHVPKTIDNDLDLPPNIDTFGYQTARHVGVGVIQNLMVDAKTTGRWYFVIAMGRKAGHLALGMGKAAGATLTLIPEEFSQGSESAEVSIDQLVDVLAGAIIKRASEGRRDGVAVIAEGVCLGIREEDLKDFGQVERDDHGHLRLAELDIGRVLQMRVRRVLRELGMEATIVSKDIGYELRSADPIPYDMEYTRDLGYCGAQFLLDGGDGCMVSMQEGRFVPVPFEDLTDARTGRMRVRMVDVHSTRYEIARRYMIRLRPEDFSDPDSLACLSSTADMTPDEFTSRFQSACSTD